VRRITALRVFVGAEGSSRSHRLGTTFDGGLPVFAGTPAVQHGGYVPNELSRCSSMPILRYADVRGDVL
jgi:hypothetical protein